MISVGFNILDPLLIRCWAEATMDWSCGQDGQDKECTQNNCRNTYWKALTQRTEQEIRGYYQLKTSLRVISSGTDVHYCIIIKKLLYSIFLSYSGN
jgi:hypothetical protein